MKIIGARDWLRANNDSLACDLLIDHLAVFLNGQQQVDFKLRHGSNVFFNLTIRPGTTDVRRFGDDIFIVMADLQRDSAVKTRMLTTFVIRFCRCGHITYAAAGSAGAAGA